MISRADALYFSERSKIQNSNLLRQPFIFRQTSAIIDSRSKPPHTTVNNRPNLDHNRKDECYDHTDVRAGMSADLDGNQEGVQGLRKSKRGTP